MDTILAILEKLKEIWWHPEIVILAFLVGAISIALIADREFKNLQLQIIAAIEKTKRKIRKVNRKRIELRDISQVHVRKKNPNS